MHSINNPPLGHLIRLVADLVSNSAGLDKPIKLERAVRYVSNCYAVDEQVLLHAYLNRNGAQNGNV